MANSVYYLGAILSIAVSAGGLVLAYLAWQKFRGTPFGRVLFLLLPFMSLNLLEHALVVITPDLDLFVGILEVLTLVWLLVFMGGMIQLHKRMSRRPRGRSA